MSQADAVVTPKDSASDKPKGSAPVILPKQGVARVQSVLSGDTAVLLGRPTKPNQPAPVVLFTFSSVLAPVRGLGFISQEVEILLTIPGHGSHNPCF